MRHVFLWLFIGALFPVDATAQSPISGTNVPVIDFSLRDTDPDPAIPSPEAFFGFSIGDRHLSHDQVTAYFAALAAASDRVQLLPYGRTWEGRLCQVALLSAPQNLAPAALEKLRQQQQGFAQGVDGSISKDPLVIYQGCSVHGNEASGVNASVLYAWQLAAARSTEISTFLDQTLILLDPALNPDGIQRFAGWVNSHRGLEADPSPDSREHNEVWPGGRTNHYWFDLNRDWLPLTQPESQGRVALFHDWKPHLVTDHHEMGRHGTFFFQPGIPSRTHPLTPAENQLLTARVGQFHAASLEAIGSTFYTEESFDDFYYGKGSTFPDVNGSIGILFEQASARGHLQESDDGLLSFPFAVRNQLATLWSTLEAAHALRDSLRGYTARFYQNALAAGAKAGGGYEVESMGDPARENAFIRLLLAHRITVYPIAESNPARRAWFVPREQGAYRLVEAMFELRTSFTDSLFYDVSAWNMPMAWGLPFSAVAKGDIPALGEPLMAVPAHAVEPPSAEAYAYLIRWRDEGAPALVAELLEAGHVVKMATRGFEARPRGAAAAQRYPAGTVVLRTARQASTPAALHERLQKAAADGVQSWALGKGLTPFGPDLGSPSIVALDAPRIAILVGPGVNAYDAGSIWHLLDARHGLRPTLLPLDRIRKSSLAPFNAVILPDGRYGDLRDGAWDDLRNWTQAGGTLLAVQDAISALQKNGFNGLPKPTAAIDDKPVAHPQPYAEARSFRGARVLGGAIFSAEADTTHPLLFGVHRASVPVFLQGEPHLGQPTSAYATPLRVAADNALLAGYAHRESQQEWASAPLVLAARYGSGRVLAYDLPASFRAFWRGTERLLLNGLFLAPVLDSRTLAEE